MFKRLALAIVSSLVLVLGAPAVALADWGDGDALDVLNGRQGGNQIWEGLCVGASLDLSRASATRCVLQSEAAQAKPRPSVPPNIGAGLCVGASLGLSAASAVKCVAKTRKPRPPSQPPNIGQGLCVGASLDLSAASARSCAKQMCNNSCGATKPTPSTLPKTGDDDRVIIKKTEPVPTHHKTVIVKKKTVIVHKEQPSTSAQPRMASGQYAALGDSVAAGSGLPDPVRGDKRCDRTFGAYAYEVANMRGLKVNHLACAGATMGDLFSEEVLPGSNIPPQLDGAFANGTPELITITAGANDVRWSDFLHKCFVSTCGTPADDVAVNGLMNALRVKTKHVFKSIERRSSGSPPLTIMTGYYHPLSDRCAELEPRLTLQEIQWINLQTDRLNQTLARVAEHRSFAEFVPIDTVFEGHDICSDNPWVQGLDGQAPFHPTLKGQRAIARAIN